MTYHHRTDWMDPAQPVTGPAADWSAVDTAVIHYTAAANVPDGDQPDAVAAYLRAMQRDYVVNRGYSVGYMFAVDQHGHQWQLRGWEFRSAANKGHNDHTMPILVLVDGAAPASPLAVEAVRQLIAEGQRLAGRPFAIVGHGQIGATACPGVGLQAQVTAGVFTPVTPEPEPEPPEEPDEMLEYIARRADFQAHPNDPWIYVLGASCRAAVSEDFKYHPIPVIDIADVAVQYANLRKSAGL